MQVGRSRFSWKFLKVREWRGEAEWSETPLFDRGLIQRSISKHERLGKSEGAHGYCGSGGSSIP